MSKNSKPYFFQSYAIVILSVCAFLVFKEFLPKKIFTESGGLKKNVVVDSLLIEALETSDTIIEKDTVVEKEIVFKETEGIKFPPETFDNYKGYQYLISLYEKLYELETNGEGNVRVAYFGDSMNDGDMIVQDFRSSLQEKFGGEGVGLVNITSESAASRSTVTHQFSGNWKTQSYLNIKNPVSPFGVNGHVFFTKTDTVNPVWVKYKANNFRHLTRLNSPTLFYGKSNNQEAQVAIITGKDTVYKKLAPASSLNTLMVSSGSLKSFQVIFKEADSIPFYGFNFDNGKGIHVDNFSNRGNSGLPITSLNKSVMRQFNEKLGYDLIVLQYGTNVLNYGSLNYSWYEKRMERVVNHLRECFPGVAILVVSVADKSTKYDLEMKTDSAVAPLIRAQKRYAVESEAAFVNLYTLMGGDGSMVKWVEEVPALANKDYTHFNYKGAKKISDLIYNQLISGYEQYKKLKYKAKKRQPEQNIQETDSLMQKTDTIHEE